VTREGPGGRQVVLEGHLGEVTALTSHPAGNRLATGGRDYTVGVWELETGAEVLLLEGHTKVVLEVRFSHDGAWLAATAEDGSVLEWDATPVNRSFIGVEPADSEG
jgi:WD40 repeat protein